MKRRTLIQNLEWADENIYNFYKFFETTWFQDIADYSWEISKASGSLQIPQDSNMSSGELLKFSNYILKIIYWEQSGESRNTTISTAMLRLRSFSGHWVMNEGRKYWLKGQDRFWYLITELISPNGIDWSTSTKLSNAAKSKEWLIWMLEEKESKGKIKRPKDKPKPKPPKYTTADFNKDEQKAIKLLGL